MAVPGECFEFYTQRVTFGMDPERFLVVCETKECAKFFEQMAKLLDEESGGVLSGHSMSLHGWRKGTLSVGELRDVDESVVDGASSSLDEWED